MSTHNICLYEEVKKKYTGCNLKTMEFLGCMLIGVCVVIRLNTVSLCAEIKKISVLFGWKKKNCLIWNYAFICVYVWISLLCEHGERLISSNTIITLSIGTPCPLTLPVRKLEIFHSVITWSVQNIVQCMANSVDPDQMPHYAASDLGLHCLQRPICPNI